ncbi:MAG: hypothetical protein CBC35_08440 [Planctomycetes bacterium TMED75]|nr:heme NO-binding protein [Planctomycetaceae bacterium]OUU91863.1 MAG: hypothetical protein CBC35_08440 [Planctomycetes bacterium TMED75]
MYGLINKAISGLVIQNFGTAAWQEICQAANLDTHEFVSMEQYPDSITYDLVGAASKVLDLPPEVILETFGRYWVEFVGQQNYGKLMDAAGGNLGDFLENLDEMHARIMLSYPKLIPPSFKLSNRTSQSMSLHYSSTRAGLEPLVVGLLRGLADRFEIRIDVQQEPDRDEHGAAVFNITIL